MSNNKEVDKVPRKGIFVRGVRVFPFFMPACRQTDRPKLTVLSSLCCNKNTHPLSTWAV